MSEILPHTAETPKSYSRKNDDFLGDFGVVYNYIHSNSLAELNKVFFE